MQVILAAKENNLRLGLQVLLTEEPNVDVVGTASTISGLLALLKANQVDLVILDDDMSSKQTSDLIAQIKNCKSKPNVILLYSHDISPQFVSEMGIEAYVNKNEPPDRLIAAFRRIAAKKFSKLEDQEKENSSS